MTLTELEATLPNGLHDAYLHSVTIDYVARVARFTVDVWVGTVDLPGQGDRERERRAELRFTGLVYCSIDPPDLRPQYRSALEAGPVALMQSNPVDPRSPLPEDAFEARLFVSDWNAFITIAALDVSLRWTDESPSPLDGGEHA